MAQHLRRLAVLRSSVHSTHFKRLTVACTPVSGAQIPLVWTPRSTLSTRAKPPIHTKNKLKINQFYIWGGSGIIPKNKRTDQESYCKSRSGPTAAPGTMALGDFSQLSITRHGACYVKKALNTLLCFLLAVKAHKSKKHSRICCRVLSSTFLRTLMEGAHLGLSEMCQEHFLHRS